VNIAIPRIRDFRGISGRSFDGRQLQPGVKEQIFPGNPVRPDRSDSRMDITISTSAPTTNTDARCSNFQLPSVSRYSPWRKRTCSCARKTLKWRRNSPPAAELKELIATRRPGGGRAAQVSCRQQRCDHASAAIAAPSPDGRAGVRKFGLARTKLREAANAARFRLSKAAVRRAL